MLYCDATECLLSCHCCLVLLFVIVVIFCSLSSKSGCGDQSRSARTRQGGRVDVDPTETEFLPTYPFGSKFLPPATPYTEEEARNTTRRRTRPARLIKAIKPPGSNWTPKSPPHTHRRLIADAIYRYRYCAGLEPASRHRGENRRLPSLSQQALGVPNWRQ